MRRVQQLLANLKKPSPSNQLTSRHLWSVIITYKDQSQVEFPETLEDIYDLNFEQTPGFTIKIARLAKLLETAYRNLLAKGKNAQRAYRKKDLLHSAYNRTAYQHIRGQRSVPLTALKDDHGAFVADPASIDDLLQAKWRGIYDGNHAGQATATSITLLSTPGVYFERVLST